MTLSPLQLLNPTWLCALTGAASTVRPAQPPSGSGGGGVRDVYAATYEEASQQVLDDYYLRSGGSAHAGRAQGDRMRDRHGEGGKRAASAREQVSSALIRIRKEAHCLRRQIFAGQADAKMH